MRVQTQVKNLTDPEKAQFEQYLVEKLKRVEPLIDSHYPDEDTVKLDCRIRKHERHTVFEFEYVMDIPKTGHLVFGEKKHTITEVMDKSTDRLERKLHEHFKKLTRE